jgi:hypothetical protein
MFDSGWLPTQTDPDPPRDVWSTPGGLACSRPAWSPAALASLGHALAAAAPAFRALSLREVIDALDATHSLWLEPESELLAEAVERVRQATGYARVSIREGLRGLFNQLTGEQLESALCASGTDLEEPSSAGRLGWVGPRLTTVIASGNIPGAALPSVVQALMLRSPCLVKTAGTEPVLLTLYARSLARAAPELARHLAVTSWEGGRDELDQAAVRHAEAVVVYGSDDALRAYRALLPLRCRFLGYGHRLSFAAIARERLEPHSLDPVVVALCRDVCIYDQQGCLSPQRVYVETGGELGATELLDRLAIGLELFARELPRKALTAAEAAAIHQFRTSIEMRAFSDPRVALRVSPQGTGWTAAIDREPGLQPCCLNRTVILTPVAELRELPGILAPCRTALQSAVVAAPPARAATLARMLFEAGVSRVAPLGSAQLPQDLWHHDGLAALAELANWTTNELPGQGPSG